MKKSKVRLGFKPAVAVPGAIGLVALLAGLVAFPHSPLPHFEGAADLIRHNPASIAPEEGAGLSFLGEGGLAELIVPGDAVAEEAEIVQAAAVPEIAPVPMVLTGRAPLGLEFTPSIVVRSPNQVFSLELQDDGSLVLLNEGLPVFSLGATGADSRVVLQTNGNLVQYVADTIVNETGTAGSGGVALQVTNDGNVVIVDAAGEPVWGLFGVPGSQLFMRAQNLLPAHSPEVAWSELRGPNTTHRVLLTFDDCPRSAESFRAAVDFAADNEIGMLLFPTTQCVDQFNAQGFDMVSYARERGMWVGNHSVSHPQLPKLTDEEIRTEITGQPYTNLVRPPYGAISDRVRAVAAANDIRLVLWDVDTNDWQGPKSSQEVINYVVANSRPGSNVLMHMQHGGFNPQALGAMLNGLTARGLQLCPPAAGPTTEIAPAELCM